MMGARVRAVHRRRGQSDSGTGSAAPQRLVMAPGGQCTWGSPAGPLPCLLLGLGLRQQRAKAAVWGPKVMARAA